MISLIYINPPFGTTRNVWDEKQDWGAPAKKTSPFAAFMAAHKGQGLSMAQLATMYKEKRA